MVQSSNQRHTETLSFRRGKILNSPEFLRHFEEKRIGEFCRAMVLFQKNKLAQKYREVLPEFFNFVLISPLLRTPIDLTQKLWQNTSYLQLSGLNNWFYVVITIFLSTWIFAVQNWWNDGAFYPHLATRQATLIGGCVGFEPFVATASPYTTHAGHEKKNLAWLAKSATDRKMLSLMVLRSFRVHHINVNNKAIFWRNF